MSGKLEKLFEFFCIFLSRNELYTLKQVNKYWYKKIIPSWLVYKLYFIYSNSAEIYIRNNYLFLERVKVMSSACKRLIIPKRFYYFSELYVTNSTELRFIEFPRTLRHLYMCNTRTLDLSCLTKCLSQNIVTLQLNDMNLSGFKVSNSWVNLEYLVLTNSTIFELEIPKECDKLVAVNISATDIRKLSIKANLVLDDFLLYCYNMKNRLDIYCEKSFQVYGTGDTKIQFVPDI